jgi:hypothetical protein
VTLAAATLEEDSMRKLMLIPAALLCLAPHLSAAQTTDRGEKVRPQIGRPVAADAGGEVTLVGCVMREADYRKMHDAGRGGVLGTGVGAGNEFVLVNAVPLSQDEAKRRAAARSAKQEMPASVGTGGAAGKTYSLTGPSEKNMVSDINRMVEVVGKVENANVEMPIVAMSVWHPVGDYCPQAR